MDQRNRRKQPRFVTNLKVNFRAGSRTGSAYCLDLSMGGLFLQTTDALSVGEWMQVSFSVSAAGEKRPVQAIVQIRRIVTRDMAAASGLLPGVGLEFRKFLQGLDELRYFLADRLGLQPLQVGQPSLGAVPDAVLGGVPDPVEVTSTMSVASIRRAQEPTRTNVPVAPIPEPAHTPAAQPPRRMPEMVPAAIPVGPVLSSDSMLPAQLEPLVPDADLDHPTTGSLAAPRPAGLAPVFTIAARTAAVVAVLVMLSWVLGWDPVPWSLLPWEPPR